MSTLRFALVVVLSSCARPAPPPRVAPAASTCDSTAAASAPASVAASVAAPGAALPLSDRLAGGVGEVRATFLSDPASPTARVRFTAGEPIYVRLDLPRSLVESRDLFGFTASASWGEEACTARVVRRDTTMFTIAIFPFPSVTASDVDLDCWKELRHSTRSDVAPLELRLVGNYDGVARVLVAARVDLDFTDLAAMKVAFARLDEAIASSERDKMRARRLPPSRLSALEPLAFSRVRDALVDDEPSPPTLLRVVVTDRDWTLYRKTPSSVVLARWIGGVAALRRSDGTCLMRDVTFNEDFDGAHYQRMTATLQAESDLLCANVWK